MFNALGTIQKLLSNEAALRGLTTKELTALHKRFSKDIVLVLDNVRKFTHMNEEKLAKLGKSKKEFVGLLRNIDPNVLQRVLEAFRGV